MPISSPIYIRLVIWNKETFIVGCTYRHPFMEISDFNKYYLSNLIEALSLRNKKIALLGLLLHFW